MTAHHSNESGRSAGFPFPTTLPRFFYHPFYLPACPTDELSPWELGICGLPGVPGAKNKWTDRRMSRTWNPAAALYLLSPFSQPTFISLSLCLRLVYLFQSLIHGCTSLGYFFLYFPAVLFFYPLLPNEFQTDEKKTVSFRLFVFLSYSINLLSLSVRNIYYD